ncbi:hypothetical protein KR038_008615 [Drosophila bunnanda]|nr:hypothetical protein KR038_008615 [Drosophila bunnanda]
MKIKNNFIVRNFFVFHPTKNEEECKICRNSFKGSYTTTMKRHLLQYHEAAYLSEMEKNKVTEPAEKKRKFEITISRSEMKEVYKQIITNVPAEILESAPFKTLSEQIFAGLEMKPEDVLNVQES